MNFTDDTSSDEEYEPDADEEEDVSETEVEEDTTITNHKEEEDGGDLLASTPMQAEVVQAEGVPTIPTPTVIESVPMSGLYMYVLGAFLLL